MTTATPRTDHTAAERTQLFTIGCAWSSHPGRYRIDPTCEHRYRTARRAIPGTPAPNVPWAILTTDGHLRTVLAADFDGSKGGDPIADATAFSALLSTLGCPHLVSRSSRDDNGHDSRNRHVLVLLHTPWNKRTSAVITAWMSRTFPTFDATPMAHSRTAAIRFPGAPHRGGGAAELATISAPAGTDPAGVLTGAVRAPADLHTRLLDVAATAATTTPAQLATPTDARVIDSPAVLDLLVRSAADVLEDRSGVLQPAESRPELAVVTPAPHAPAPAPNPPTNADSSSPQPPVTDPLTLPVRDPAARIGVSQWAPRRDDPTSLYPVSWYTRRWTINAVRPSSRAATQPSPATRTMPASDIEARLQALPAAVQSLLHQRGDLPPGTASGPQHGTLMSLAARDWTADQVVELALHTQSAAFTHSRRSVVYGRPIPRSERDFTDHLRRQFAHAQTSLTRRANTHTAPEHRAAIADLAALVVQVLAAADADPRLQFDRYTQTLRRVLEAHLLTALSAAATQYRCGSRDLARIAGLRSPQTAATATRALTAWGYLTLVEESRGTLANRYELRVPKDWTQGEPAPQAAPTRSNLGTLLAARCGHFQHDVWLSRTLGADAALLLLHLGHLETPASELPAATGLAPSRIAALTVRLQSVGLLDEAGNVVLTQSAYEGAAHATASAGAWSKVLRHWEIARLRWEWWCAESEFLRAPRDSKHQRYVSSVLDRRGRYPRTTDGNGDHHAAAVAVAATLPQLIEEAR
ncbi:hypothetical protein [Gordonia aichiensis]|uniref:hypothetical protein n=1 Tax=Gordonia aichiensis TaxID=36820 RepID=UPI003263B555